MSKQLKYKLKKTLKNAEFVHADLEYHKELSADAVQGFQEEIARWVAMLSEEDKKKIDHPPVPPSPPTDTSQPSPSAGDDPLATEEDCDEIEEAPKEPPTPKEASLKKVFRRIASHTHPDKLKARGCSPEESARLEKLFMKAKRAYDNQNWYTLYAIALSLNLPAEGPTGEQVEWIEDDIKKTLAKIAEMANLTAWHWYTGSIEERESALKFYFQQIHGFEHPGMGSTD